MRQPQSLMRHRIDHYQATFVKQAGEKVATYTLTNEDVACNWQEATSELVTEYMQRGEKIKAVCFLCNQEAYEAISTKDRLIFGGHNFRVIGKQDLCTLGKIFRIDISEEV